MNASRSRNHAVRGVAKSPPYLNHFLSDLHAEGKYLNCRICLEIGLAAVRRAFKNLCENSPFNPAIAGGACRWSGPATSFTLQTGDMVYT